MTSPSVSKVPMSHHTSKSVELIGGHFTRKFLPGLKSLLHSLTVLSGGEQVASRAEVLCDRPVGGKEPLRVAG
jgi:hypothetical protein